MIDPICGDTSRVAQDLLLADAHRVVQIVHPEKPATGGRDAKWGSAANRARDDRHEPRICAVPDHPLERVQRRGIDPGDVLQREDDVTQRRIGTQPALHRLHQQVGRPEEEIAVQLQHHGSGRGFGDDLCFGLWSLDAHRDLVERERSLDHTHLRVANHECDDGQRQPDDHSGDESHHGDGDHHGENHRLVDHGQPIARPPDPVDHHGGPYVEEKSSDHTPGNPGQQRRPGDQRDPDHGGSHQRGATPRRS